MAILPVAGWLVGEPLLALVPLLCCFLSVTLPQETKTYEELRRALMKCRDGSRLAASLQGIWGCYQDAQRNTEAMAFRGHRLLDQVNPEVPAGAG